MVGIRLAAMRLASTRLVGTRLAELGYTEVRKKGSNETLDFG